MEKYELNYDELTQEEQIQLIDFNPEVIKYIKNLETYDTFPSPTPHPGNY